MAVLQACGEFFCFLDADDIMRPERIKLQLDACVTAPDPYTLVGCQFDRTPSGSAPRYTKWANNLTQQELLTESMREITMIQPTWFFRREVFDRVGGYSS